MLKVVYKPAAHNSILRIMLYIDSIGYPDTALNFSERLYGFGETLGEFPEKYPICRYTQPKKKGYRCAVFESDYVFIYKISKRNVTVINIVHTSLLK